MNRPGRPSSKLTILLALIGTLKASSQFRQADLGLFHENSPTPGDGAVYRRSDCIIARFVFTCGSASFLAETAGQVELY
jgi:hypothetical protein